MDEGHPDVAVRKTGDGTLTLNGAVELRGRPVAVEGGTVKFGASVCAGEASAYSVNGGGIAAAASTTNSVGPLAVGPEGASIEIGEGTVLEFADSSGQAWSGDVTVTGFAEKSIRFGTNANGLTKAQRVRIGIGTGEDVYISAKGWLTLTPPGMFIAIQ